MNEFQDHHEGEHAHHDEQHAQGIDARRSETVNEAKLLESIAEIERQIGAFRETRSEQEEDERTFSALCLELVRTRESREGWAHSWEQAQAEAENASIQLQRAKDSLVARAQQIEILQAQLNELPRHPNDEHTHHADDGSRHTTDSFLDSRKARLARYRALIQAEAEKVILAEGLIAERLAQVEQAEAQNAELRKAVEQLVIEREQFRVKLAKAAEQIADRKSVV